MATIPKKSKKKNDAPLIKTPVVATPANDSLPAKTKGTAKATIKASKYRGIKSGMRVMEFQDSTFAANVKTMLTDAELVALWRQEFPNAVAFTENHVKGARRDYNVGRHSKAFAALKPATPLAEVVIVNGKRTWVTDAPAPAKAEKKAAAPAPVAAEPKKTKAVPKSKAA